MIASSNHFLGEFMISGIPEKKAGKEAIKVAFSYDLNGMLDVQATIMSNNKKASIQIDMQKSARSKDTGEAEHTREPEQPEIDISRWEEAPGAQNYRALIRRAERLLKKAKTKGSAETAELLEATVRLVKEALVTQQNDMLDHLEETLSMIIELAGLNL